MINLHGLILADRSSRDLRELVMCRTSSSLPFAGRYRLIDFALSNLQNAGVRDVGVVMQRNYSSLLDHIGSGKEWDMSRKRGGLRLLPPFGLDDGRRQYSSIIDALISVQGYIRDIKQDYVCLCRGSLAANIDLAAVMRHHVASKADVTVVCYPIDPEDADYAIELAVSGVSDTGMFITIAIPVTVESGYSIDADSVYAYSIVNGERVSETAYVSGDSIVIETTHNTPFYIGYELESDLPPFIPFPPEQGGDPVEVGPIDQGGATDGGDDTLKVVACAAAAVVAAILIIVLASTYRKNR